MCQFRSEWRLSFRQLFHSDRASFTITMMNAVSTGTTQPFDFILLDALASNILWTEGWWYPCYLQWLALSALSSSEHRWLVTSHFDRLRPREQTKEDQTASAFKRNDSTLPPGPSNVLRSEDHPQRNWGWLTGSAVCVCVCFSSFDFMSGMIFQPMKWRNRVNLTLKYMKITQRKGNCRRVH